MSETGIANKNNDLNPETGSYAVVFGAECERYDVILAADAESSGGDSELVAAAQELVALWREPERDDDDSDRIWGICKKISHTVARGPAGLRAKAIAARLSSGGFASPDPTNDGSDGEDLAFSLCGDLLNMPHDRRLGT